MTSSVNSVEDIVNQALDCTKYPLRIGSIWEGSEASSNALDIYGQTRDALLRERDWGFAKRDISLTLIKSAPPGGYNPVTPWNPTDYPQTPWLYEYAYPGDCLKLRAIKRAPTFIPDFAPDTELWQIASDSTQPAGQTRVILANAPQAIGVYTARVTDMTQWEPSFTEELIATLGRKLAQALGFDVQDVQADAQEEGKADVEAGQRRRG